VPDPDESLELEVLYEDADIVVVDKPAGLPVHPPRGAASRGGTLVNALLARFPEMARLGDASGHGPGSERPGIVHRIDRMTSGLLVVARSERGFAGLSRLVRGRALDRAYAALCGGRFSTESGVVDAPIGRKPGSRSLGVESGGRPARSRYEVEAEWVRPEVTAVSVILETGRTHQIRVHMRAIGHPVVGDPAYGGRMLPGAGRQMLHARHLGFAHPVTGDRLEFDSPVPADMSAVITSLGPPERGQVPTRWLGQGVQP
jgi:23S rRNA pseudouridine1911/1915/1917 synthase